MGKMNRQQRRNAAKHKGNGQSFADVIAKRKIGEATLRMAMEDKAVALAADILCQRQLWAAVIALNERFQFGPKRTKDFLSAIEQVTDDFESMKKENGDAYAEEKLRERAEQVSGVKIRYQHEAEREAWEKMQAKGAGGDGFFDCAQNDGAEDGASRIVPGLGMIKIGERIATAQAPRNDRTGDADGDGE